LDFLPGCRAICPGSARACKRAARLGVSPTTACLGRQAVKGFTEPVEAFVVEDVAVIESRFEAARRRHTDLVGRAAESALLCGRLREAWGGAGQIILLSCDAGIGNSRLAAQLAAEGRERAAHAVAPSIQIDTTLNRQNPVQNHAVTGRRSEVNRTAVI
jgi:hypothetical protein